MSILKPAPPQIRRDNVQRRVVIQANVEERDMGGLVRELEQRINSEIDMPAGYSVVFGGQYENQQRAQARLMIVVPVSLALIFLLLYLAFGSSGQAALIMTNVPLALIGGIIALWLSGQYLSVPSSIGFIALFGVAVLNGVVMVTSINRRVDDSDNLMQAIEEGANSRLRAGADDRIDHRAGTDSVAACDRCRFGDPAPAGNGCRWWPGVQYPVDAAGYSGAVLMVFTWCC